MIARSAGPLGLPPDASTDGAGDGAQPQGDGAADAQVDGSAIACEAGAKEREGNRARACLLGQCAGAKGCCSAPVAKGATFNRYNKPAFPATVSDVRLNQRRLRERHVRAGRADRVEQQADELCDYAEAFAFCIWDGGRLPTVAELELATRGGTEQRAFPWGPDAMDATHAFYCSTRPANMPCVTGPDTPGGMLNVGSVPQGAGRFGHLDLFGSMREYTLDIFTPMPKACVDCAQLDTQAATTHGALGGSWTDTGDAWTSIYNVAPTTSTNPRTPAGGFRCAYDLQPDRPGARPLHVRGSEDRIASPHEHDGDRRSDNGAAKRDDP